jgi:hypothetical protein
MSNFQYDPTAPEFFPSFMVPRAYPQAPAFPHLVHHAYRPAESFFFPQPPMMQHFGSLATYSIPNPMIHHLTLRAPTLMRPFDAFQFLRHSQPFDYLEDEEDENEIEASTLCSICEEDADTIVGMDMGGEHFQQRPCRHRFCNSCLVQWITTKVDDMERRIPCPHPTCKYHLYPSDVERIAPHVAAKYKELLSQDYKARLREMSDVDEASASFLRTTAASCPDCKVLMMKTEGCDSIRCTCGTNFCYRCKQMYVDDQHTCGCRWLHLDLSMPYTCQRCTFINERTGHWCEACESFRHSSDDENSSQSDDADDDWRSRFFDDFDPFFV